MKNHEQTNEETTSYPVCVDHTADQLGGQYTDLEKKRDDVVLYFYGFVFLVAVIYSVFSQVALPYSPIMWLLGALILLLQGRVAQHPYWRLSLLVVGVGGAVWLGLSYGSQQREMALAARWTQADEVVATVRIEGLSDDIDQGWRQVVVVQQPVQYEGQRWLINLPYGASPSVAAQADQQYRAGQLWQMRLQVKPIRGVASHHAFDAEQWLLTRHIVARATLQHAQLKTDQPNELDQLQRLRGALRQQFRPFHSPEYGVLLGLLTGDRALITPEIKQLYQKMGISHLLAISGPHVLFLAAIGTWLLQGLLNRWPRLYLWQPRQRLLLPLWWGMVAAYALLAGFEIPAQRTLAMATVFVMTMYMQKHLNVLKSLLIIAVVMVIVDPLMLWSAAFWLSYGAVAILLVWSLWHQPVATAPIGRWAYFKQQIGQMSRLQGMLTLSLLPLVLAIFGQLSWLAWPVNLLAIPVLGVLVIGLNLLGLVAWTVHTNTGVWIWQLTEPLLGVFHQVLWGLADVFPQALMPWRMEGRQWAVLAMMVAWWLLPRGVLPRWPSVLLLPLVLWSSPPPPLKIQVLDVGQGLSVLIQTPNHRLLFDTGTAGMTQQVVLPAVQTIGQVQLDRVMISHADQDHAGGVAILQQATAVGRWQLGQPLPELPNSQPCVSGQTWLWDGVRFEVLAPFATGWSDLPDNEQSCVLRISTPPDANGQVSRVLIMGDAGHLTEQVLLLMCADLRADVLIVGHHGSKTSSSAHFIAAVQPVRAVIAAGYANRFGHPHRVVIDTLQQAGVQIDSTIDSGTLTYTLGQGVLAPPVEQRSRWPWLSWPN